MIPYERILEEGNWTLFLDRDGTINKRIPADYVKSWNEFEFLPGALEAIKIFSNIFKHVIIVTNQQGIGKGIMTDEQLALVHDKMTDEIISHGGYVDQIYYCPHLAIHDPSCRKPNPGMAIQAASDYEDINFKKSLMVGDTLSDMQFGFNLAMQTVLIGNNEITNDVHNELIGAKLPSLSELATYLRFH